MENKFKFRNHQAVSFQLGDVHGGGNIVGVSSIEVAIFGATYLVKVVDSNTPIPNDTYPFSVIAVPECFITAD